MCLQEAVPEERISKLPVLIPHDWTTYEIRWFKVNSTGINDSGLNKYQIMEYAQIDILDMMTFDRHGCTILGRERFILLDLEIIKMVIKPEEVLVMEIREPKIMCVYNELVRIFDENAVAKEESLEDLWDADHDYVTPLEFRALKVSLEAICCYYREETHKLENDIHLAWREISSSKISDVNWERVLKFRPVIFKLKTSVEKVIDELTKLMKNDDDIAALYLSRKLDHSSSNVEEILMMLQPYFKKLDMAKQWLRKLEEDVHDKVEFIEFQSANYRNQLIKFKLIPDYANIYLPMFALVVLVLGMNINSESGNNQKYTYIWVVSLVGAAVCVIMSVHIMSYSRYRKLRNRKVVG